ncbi:MAG: hypothetical protein QOD06_3493 [Candidatus Binatota bacterium]|nr:hypothetical protein [Candidatus Binatota bacterium]
MNGAWRAALAIAGFALAVAVYLPGAWGIPFSGVPEPLEALVVREMRSSGDWVLPRRNFDEIPAKPPLYHWVALAAASIRGEVDELAARMPSVLFAAATVALVFAAGAENGGPAAGALAAVALGTSPEWAHWAVMARTDATFAFFVAATLLLGERWLRGGRDPLLIATALAAAAAVLTKGPAGVLFPAAVLAAETWRRAAWHRFHTRQIAVAAALVVVIAGSWYAAAGLRLGADFYRKQIFVENVSRFLPGDADWPSRTKPFYFYLPALLIGMAPWSLALPAAIAGGGRSRGEESGFRPFLIVWISVILAVCTLASGKRSNYVLPMYPAAALLIGDYLAGLLEAPAAEKTLRTIGIVTAALLLVTAGTLAAWALGLEPWRIVLPWLHSRDRQLLPSVAGALGKPSFLLPVAGAATAAVVLATLRARAWSWMMGTAGAALIGVVLSANVFFRPAEARLKSFRGFATRVATRVPADAPLSFYRKPNHALLFYLGRKVPVEYVDFAAIPRPGWALVWESDWRALPIDARFGTRPVATSQPAASNRPDSRLLLIRLRRTTSSPPRDGTRQLEKSDEIREKRTREAGATAAANGGSR